MREYIARVYPEPLPPHTLRGAVVEGNVFEMMKAAAAFFEGRRQLPSHWSRERWMKYLERCWMSLVVLERHKWGG